MTDQETKQTFEEAIKEHLITNRSELVRSAVSSAIEELAESLKWTAMSCAQEQLKSFFEKEVGPEVAKALDANREILITTVVATMHEVVNYGLKKQAEDWMKEMDNSYSRAGVIQKMFGGRGY